MLCLSFVGSALAYDSPSNEDCLISIETISINGIRTEVKTYFDEGFTVKTYRFIDPDVSKDMMESAIASIEAADTVTASADLPLSITTTPVATHTKKFSTSARAPSNIRCEASQSGTFCKSNQDYAYLWVTGGKSNAGYTDPDYTPDSIWITETFTTTGLSLSISWPPSVSLDSTTYQKTLGPYHNVNFVTSNWPQVSARKTAGTGFSMTVQTEVDAYLSGDHQTYGALTSFTQNFQIGW